MLQLPITKGSDDGVEIVNGLGDNGIECPRKGKGNGCTDGVKARRLNSSVPRFFSRLDALARRNAYVATSNGGTTGCNRSTVRKRKGIVVGFESNLLR